MKLLQCFYNVEQGTVKKWWEIEDGTDYAKRFLCKRGWEFLYREGERILRKEVFTGTNGLFLACFHTWWGSYVYELDESEKNTLKLRKINVHCAETCDYDTFAKQIIGDALEKHYAVKIV